jgi:hypothetical protein
MEAHPNVKSIWENGMRTLAVLAEDLDNAKDISDYGGIQFVKDLAEHHSYWTKSGLHAVHLLDNISANE